VVADPARARQGSRRITSGPVVSAGYWCGLLSKSLRNLKMLDAGFDRDNVLLAVSIPEKPDTKTRRLPTSTAGLVEQTRQIPGVQSASLSMLTPISGGR